MHDKVLVIETNVSNICLSNPAIQKALLENCSKYELIFFKKKHYHVFDTDLIRYLRKNKKFPEKEFEKKVIPGFVNSLLNPFPKGSFESYEINGNKIMVSEDEYFILPVFDKKMHLQGLGFLEILFNDEHLQDVYINSPNTGPLHVFHSKYGELRTNIYVTDKEIERIGTYLRFHKNRAFDEANPKIDTNVGRVRVCGVTYPLSEGTGFAFRRHSTKPFTLAQITDAETAAFLSFLADNPVSILIAGPRGSGKTSFLGALMAEINSRKRMVVIEDTQELPCTELLQHGFNIQRLIVKPPVSKNEFELDADDALKTALRLGESVLVVGEVRGREARTLFEAMRVGAAGSCVLGTIHSGSAEDVFDRIVNDLNVPRTSFKAVDLIITLGQLSEKEYGAKKRIIVEITEILKDWDTKPEFRKIAYFDFHAKKLRFNDLRKSLFLRKILKMNSMNFSDFKKSIAIRKKMKCINLDFSGAIANNEKIRQAIKNKLR